MTCDDVLKKQSLSFEKFKRLYGDPDEKGIRTIKVGNQTFEVDTINYKFKKAIVDTHRSLHHCQETQSFRLQKKLNTELTKERGESTRQNSPSSRSRRQFDQSPITRTPTARTIFVERQRDESFSALADEAEN